MRIDRRRRLRRVLRRSGLADPASAGRSPGSRCRRHPRDVLHRLGQRLSHRSRRSGETLLVHGGTSGIGSTALMLAKEFGIRTITTDDGADKCRAALQLGTETAVDFREYDFLDAVRNWSNGTGVDIILDIVGGAYLQHNLAALAKDGRLLSIGYLGGEVAPDVNLLAIALKRATLTGSTMRSRTLHEKAVIATDLLTKVWPALNAGRCRPVIHEVFRLARAADAHRMMETGKHIGKIVLDATV